MSDASNPILPEGGLLLPGLDGSNPLAFLAALGTLRVASKALTAHRVAMAWQIDSGAWRPSLRTNPAVAADELLGHVAAACRYGLVPKRQEDARGAEGRWSAARAELDSAEVEKETALKKQGLSGKKLAERLKEHLGPLEEIVSQRERALFEIIGPYLLIGDDLTLDGAEFRRIATRFASDSACDDRCAADFMAAFGSDAVTGDDGRITDTALRTMAGAGHQHFLGFMRNVVVATTPEHLRKALFERWRYDDPVQNLTLRWDPADDSRYALQWRNPSGDPSRRTGGSMLGANRLAIEGLPLMPTAPQASALATTGFRGRKSSDTFWTWPIWTVPLDLDVVRSLLSRSELQADVPNHADLLELGICDVFRSQRLTIGKVRNFTPGQSI